MKFTLAQLLANFGVVALWVACNALLSINGMVVGEE